MVTGTDYRSLAASIETGVQYCIQIRVQRQVILEQALISLILM